MTPELSEPWVPGAGGRPETRWVPAVGDRVRIRLSGECRLSGPTGKRPDGVIVQTGGHVTAEHGRTGVIKVCSYIAPQGYCLHAEMGHPYIVQFDERLSDAETGITSGAGHYCAAELEPADWDGRL